jgi:inorganic pyrophosphatase
MDEPLHCLVEIPKGSRNKYEWDCVPHEDPNWSGLRELGDLPEQLRIEIEHFFSIYKQPEGKDVTVDGWYERDVALQVIEESRTRWRETRS